jgi:hypothetical protein
MERINLTEEEDHNSHAIRKLCSATVQSNNAGLDYPYLLLTGEKSEISSRGPRKPSLCKDYCSIVAQIII